MLPGFVVSALACLPLAALDLDFDSEVRPILSQNCFACHGPDESSREADLRLDTREGALADLGGYAAVVPGDLEASELWLRVTAEDAYDLMPPPKSHKPQLGSEELATLRAWIEEGAAWTRHWAFVPPVKVALEEPSLAPIDELVSRELRTRGLELAPRAATHTLARRLALDLTGLPPAPEALEVLGWAPGEGAAGSESPGDEAWAAFVETLLASPHYGERMAMWWLDGARYADSDGFQQDATRTNWPWRDWVVEAFTNDLPFDEFTRLQLAGDLLPEATPEQVLATCFQRNHMHNGEGGRDPEESRVDYVRDRTNTVGMVWLGLTLECAQCHDHKFDPVSQRDYYSLSAFFDSIEENGSAGGGAGPFLGYTSPRAVDGLELAREELAAAEAYRATVVAEHATPFESWLAERVSEVQFGFEPWTPLVPTTLATDEGSGLKALSDGSVRCTTEGLAQEDYFLTAGPTGLDRITGLQLEVLPGADGALSFTDDGEFIVTGIKLRVHAAESTNVRDVELVHAAADLVGKGVDAQYGPPTGVLDDDPRTGWTTRGEDASAGARIVLQLGEPLVLAPGERLVVEVLQRSTVPMAHLRRFRLSVTDQPGAAVRELGPMPMEELARHEAARAEQAEPLPLPAELRERLFAQYLLDVPEWVRAQASAARFAAQLRAAERANGALQVTVLKERAEPRVTSILLRGEWDKKGEAVSRGFLPAIFDRDAGEAPTRLDLASWVTAPDNPLTARAIVNQVWQQLFGRGLVRTPSDFGLQGARPLHQDLLDWLAVDFVEHGWSVKHLVRTIVSSRTYRQDSACSADLLERDPSNEWLARGARFRLPSWMIRDVALAASGLLERSVGGPPMFPPQPAGIWEDVFNGRFRYQPTHGRARHRRSLYAFWRRNASPTFFFDSADRRTCSVDLRLTNTPLQALTLLNDRTFFQAALALAKRAVVEETSGLGARLQFMARAVLQREFTPEELAVVLRVWLESAREFAADESRAAEFIAPSALDAQGPAATTPGEEAVELASTTLVASLILNLDEAVSHE